MCNSITLIYMNKKEAINGEKVSLIKATLSDQRKIYDWLANSSVTPSMMGGQLYAEIPVPTWNEFQQDYSRNHPIGSEK